MATLIMFYIDFYMILKTLIMVSISTDLYLINIDCFILFFVDQFHISLLKFILSNFFPFHVIQHFKFKVAS
jgi:hypothetical protein